MMLAAALLLGAGRAGTVGRGAWQVSTTVSGDDAVSVTQHCVTEPERWVGELVPRRFLASCSIDRAGDPFGSVWGRCGGGGTLTVTGNRRVDRVDLVVKRTGRVGANPHAAMTAIVQGIRIDAACPRTIRPPTRRTPS